MSGRSQSQKSQRTLSSAFKKHRSGGDRAVPPRGAPVALPPAPALPDALPMSRSTGGDARNSLQTGAASSGDAGEAPRRAPAPAAARSVLTTMLKGTTSDGPRCSCHCNPARLDKADVKLGCQHVTPKPKRRTEWQHPMSMRAPRSGHDARREPPRRAPGTTLPRRAPRSHTSTSTLPASGPARNA